MRGGDGMFLLLLDEEVSECPVDSEPTIAPFYNCTGVGLTWTCRKEVEIVNEPKDVCLLLCGVRA